jgi:nicotinate-nucleotide adenylyltransferase
MRIGVFGGTFDPIHLGHLILAEQCRDQGGLDQVLFVLAARPPHKLDAPLSPFRQRLEMLELAISGQSGFQISRIEEHRPGPSYTADTLRELVEQQPGLEWFLLVGADTVRDLGMWYCPDQVAAMAQLLVVGRAGIPLPSEPPSPFRWQVVTMPLLEISSTDIRQRLQAGRSIRYLVPRAVECYIDQHRLYRYTHAV